jgi:hypothetical protein
MIRWAELLRKTFGFEIVCEKCHSQLRLIALIKTEAVAKKILKAMHLPTELGPAHPALPHAASPRPSRSFIPCTLHARHPGTRAAAMTG